VEKGEIQVKVLMFPLAMHKGAREQCVSVICDKKSFEDLENGYKSENQCAEGAKIVDDTIALLSGKGITGTPTYIFPDGRFQSGSLEAAVLRQRLGIPAPAGEAPAKKAPAPPAAPAAPKK
jgi:thiol:disulfide interchange protein DsbC